MHQASVSPMEEIEYSSMVLDWIRRNSPDFDKEMKTHLFLEGDILDAEELATSYPTAPISRAIRAAKGSRYGISTV